MRLKNHQCRKSTIHRVYDIDGRIRPDWGEYSIDLQGGCDGTLSLIPRINLGNRADRNVKIGCVQLAMHGAR
jgi:hypothetical protein